MSGSDVARECRSRGSRPRSLLPALRGRAAETSQTLWHMRSGAPRERLRFSSELRMPPDRKSRTKRDRRAGATPGRKARPGSGSTPGKAARSSQRTLPAGPRAAPSAVSAAAAAAEEEESRLRQRNRLTLEDDDKPAAERCLEQLVFGDVEDDEDALLQRLRSSRVRKACLRSGHTLRRGARREARPPGGAEPGGGTCGGECSGGRDRRPRAPRGAVALFASGSGLRAGEGGTLCLSPPQRGCRASYPAGAQLLAWFVAGCLPSRVAHLRALTPSAGNHRGGRLITCRDSV